MALMLRKSPLALAAAAALALPAAASADIIEVGVPWSDPSADGKAIQAAMHRALAKGGGLRRSLALFSRSTSRRSARRSITSAALVRSIPTCAATDA